MNGNQIPVPACLQMERPDGGSLQTAGFIAASMMVPGIPVPEPQQPEQSKL